MKSTQTDEKPIENFCIVLKSADGPLALINKDGSLHLPVVTMNRRSWLPNHTFQVNRDLMDSYGLNCTLLRWLDSQPDHNLVVMEWHPGSDAVEQDVEWVHPDTDSGCLPATHRQMIERWKSSDPDGLMEWEKPGWMKNLALILIKVFNGRDFPKLLELSQFKAAWGMSTLLLIKTTDSDYFFKAGARHGLAECVLTRYLNSRFPENIPRPLMIDDARGWMLTRRIEGEPSEFSDPGLLDEVFRVYAKIQLECLDLFQNPIAENLKLRTTDWFKSHIERLFSTDQCYEEFRSQVSALDERQRDDLRQTWDSLADQVQAFRVPMLLSYEDFHRGNILLTDSGPVFIDWADCARAHPFFGLHQFLRLLGKEPTDALSRAKIAIRNAYVESFSQFASPGQLEAEFKLTDQLSLLYQSFRCVELSLVQKRDSPWGIHCFNRAGNYLRLAISAQAH